MKQAIFVLSDPRANARYNGVREHVRGASRSCAAKNGATDHLSAAGVTLVGDNAVPGTQGAASFRHYYADGWNVALF
ncbi:MAG TPA: hypothetical protein VGL42_00580 [Opitutaceae bacterium]|jgi:hypothetical protein